MIANKVIQNCAERSHEATQLAVENGLLNLFMTGTVDTEERMKFVPYRYNETILTAIAIDRTYYEVFSHSFERWTQSTSFCDVFTQQALNWRRFTHPVANFVKCHM